MSKSIAVPVATGTVQEILQALGGRIEEKDLQNLAYIAVLAASAQPGDVLEYHTGEWHENFLFGNKYGQWANLQLRKGGAA